MTTNFNHPIAQQLADTLCETEDNRRLGLVGPENMKQMLIPNMDPAYRHAQEETIKRYTEAIEAIRKQLLFADTCEALGNVEFVEDEDGEVPVNQDEVKAAILAEDPDATFKYNLVCCGCGKITKDSRRHVNGEWHCQHGCV